MSSRQSADRVHKTAAALVGAPHVRLAEAGDVVGEALPQIVVEPAEADAAAAVLAWASRDGVPLAVRGAGTKLAWGTPVRAADVVLSTAGLRSVVEHRHGDLTATVQAGATLADVNRHLRAHRQILPLDPSFGETATIGGILATNDSGPRRHRYGAPRDQIIGITIARTDGRLVKSGGIVVKNVAGYDLGRLMTGSFGTLAVTIDATFKLVPTAPVSKTVVVTPGSLAELEAMRAEIAGSQLMPTAVEVQMPPGRLLVRFETSVRAAEQQAADVMAMAERHRAQWEEVSGAAEQTLWEGHAERPWNGSGCVCKISVLPDELVSLLQWLRDTPGLPRWDLVGRAALGVVLLRLEGDVADQEPVVAALRARAPAGRAHVSILRAEPELKRRLGAWDEPADTLPLKQAIKRQFDPAGILNPGRGPGGL